MLLDDEHIGFDLAQIFSIVFASLGIDTRRTAIPKRTTVANTSIIVRVDTPRSVLAPNFLVCCLSTASQFTVVTSETADTAADQGGKGDVRDGNDVW